MTFRKPEKRKIASEILQHFFENGGPAMTRTIAAVWVTVNHRRFIVEFGAAGEPVSIKERKTLHAGHPYLEHIYNAPYWSARHHKIGGPKTIVSRILAEAQT